MTVPQEKPQQSRGSERPRRRRWPFVLAGAIVAAAVLVVGGTALYINVIREDAPEAFAFTDDSQTAAAPTGTIEGSWTVAAGSQAGYRVDEVLVGQNVEAAGRTSEVSGSMTIEGTQVTAAEFEVDMASVATDSSQRDREFDTRIMDTATYPTSTFVLTGPIELAPVPADATVRMYTAAGDLTLRGVTRPVTMELEAQRSGDQIRVIGQIGIVFADYDIPNPSIAGFVTTEDHGSMEVDLVLEQS